VGGGPDRPGLSLIPGPVAPDRTAIVVAGPTASGKSALALAIARELGGVVVNADSMQVYRELSVLTARPGPAALAAAPHRLYGVLPAAERCSAGRWRVMAEAAAAEARQTRRQPIFVGGTGLYLRALTEGFAPVPEVPAEVAAEGARRLAALGPAGLHAELVHLDPVTAGRLAAADSQRILRAWTVFRATGRPLSEWQAEAPAGGGWRSLTIALTPPRAALYAACDARFCRMVEEGAVEEVKSLLALGLDPGLPAMRAVGVRELAGAIAGRTSLPAAIAAAQTATRRYAKRQMTWIRHQMASAYLVPEKFSERILPDIFAKIRHFLLTAPA